VRATHLPRVCGLEASAWLTVTESGKKLYFTTCGHYKRSLPTDLSRGGSRLGNDGIQCGRLSGSVRSQQSEDFASVDRKAAVIYGDLQRICRTSALQTKTLRTTSAILFVQVLHQQNCILRPRHVHHHHLCKFVGRPLLKGHECLTVNS